VTISQLVIDGEAQVLQVSSAEPSRAARPLRVPASARHLEFHFTENGRDGRPAARLRFQLEGHDDAWRDLPVQMRAIVRFRDRDNQIIGGADFSLQGETPGWRGNLDDSDYVARSEQTTAPARAVTARIAFLTHGGDAGLGLIGIDGVRLRVQGAENANARDYDLSVTAGSDLNDPTGSPRLWGREGGSRADLARLWQRATPTAHPILVLEDDDPTQYGVWTTKAEPRISVLAGDRLTLEWQTAHSIGKSGPGQASYPRLKPGRYWFRVAAAKASGELTGQEVSLPIEVVAPWYLRWEFWLVLAALAGGATVGVRQIVLRRRMQRRLAEVEREQALERERARIARDLHDEVGAGLSEIAMQSDWVRRDLAQGPTADTRRRIEQVCQSAVELTRSVDEIVWAVTPANDTLPRFANYLTQSTEQFLDAAGVRLRFDLPPELPAIALPGKVRHFLFLAVREALNNATKHARADLVRLELVTNADGLRLAVEDNGVGFDPEKAGAAGTHEGLDSMRRRMEEIGGQLQLTTRPGGGTRVEFRVPLPPEPANLTP
jgi:signal transduction histidine kinase